MCVPSGPVPAMSCRPSSLLIILSVPFLDARALSLNGLAGLMLFLLVICVHSLTGLGVDGSILLAG